MSDHHEQPRQLLSTRGHEIEAKVLSPVVPAPSGTGAADIHDEETFAQNDVNDDAILGCNRPVVPGFEILGFLGRGGMGVVYKARQINLNRIVALKMIGRGRLADKDEVRRFLAEAEAAASLKHPNIVAIHEVGEHEGQPYFTMDCVNAGNLADRMRDQPLPPECAARYLQQVAEAIHFAHEHGILHRDLKPSNVLIDEADQPHVTDFGLARRLDEASGLTISGMPVGTPNYMPPEQATGRRDDVGRASDVYSLGAMLYALVTGRPPFQGPSRHDTIEQVKSREPISPRQLQPKLPRDLETIVLKCLVKEPARRYATAAELAAELRRWRAGEPILARPVGRVERTWRWCRRNPRVAVLGTVVLLLLLTVAAGSTMAALVIDRERRLAIGAEQVADTQRQKAEAALVSETRAKESARQAVDRYVEAVQEADLLRDERFQPLRRKLLADALRYYQTLIREHAHDAAARADLANAVWRVAQIDYESGSRAEALRGYQQVRELYAAMLAQDPENAETQTALGRTHVNLGNAQSETGDRAAATASYVDALAIQKRLAAATDSNDEYRSDLADTYTALGGLQRDTGNRTAALASFQDALTIHEKLAASNPTIAAYQDHLAGACHNLGTLTSIESALPYFRRALAIREPLIAANPDGARYRSDQAKSYGCLAFLQNATGDPAASLDSYRRATAIMERLASENPSDTHFQSDLAMSYSNLGTAQSATGDRAGAAESYRHSLAVSERLVAADGDVADNQVQIGGTCCNLGSLLYGDGRPAEALPWFERASETLRAVLSGDPQNANARRYLHNTFWSQATTLGGMGRDAEAADCWLRAIELNAGGNRDMLRCYLGMSLARAGDHASAASLVDELAAFPHPPAVALYNLACVMGLCSSAAKDDPELAPRYRARAIDLLRRAREAGFFQSPENVVHLTQDADLRSLHPLDEFQRFLHDLGVAASPESR
jgi:serine/threonine-protein kinase